MTTRNWTADRTLTRVLDHIELQTTGRDYTIAQVHGASLRELEDNTKLIAAAPRLAGMLADAAFQLGRLTGEDLATYARTFSVLAAHELKAIGQ